MHKSLVAWNSWPETVHSDMMCLCLFLDMILGQVENISTHTWNKSLQWKSYITFTAFSWVKKNIKITIKYLEGFWFQPQNVKQLEVTTPVLTIRKSQKYWKSIIFLGPIRDLKLQDKLPSETWQDKWIQRTNICSIPLKEKLVGL